MIHKLDRRQLFSLACLVFGLAIVATQNYLHPIAGRAQKAARKTAAFQPRFQALGSVNVGLLSLALLPLLFATVKWGENLLKSCSPTSTGAEATNRPPIRLQNETATRAPLARSELYLELAARNAQLGFWEWDMIEGKLRFDPQLFLIGRPLDTLPELHIDRYRSTVHVADRARVDAAIEAHLSGQADFYECEYRQRLPTGACIWVHHVGKVVDWDSNGLPQRMTGTYRHITAGEVEKQLLP